jgi:hypothetical protein
MKKAIVTLFLVVILCFSAIADSAGDIQVSVSTDKTGDIYVGDEFDLIVSLSPLGNTIEGASLTFSKIENNFDFNPGFYPSLQALQKTGNIFTILGSNQPVSIYWYMSGASGAFVILDDEKQRLGKIPIVATAPGQIQMGLVTEALQSQIVKETDQYSQSIYYDILPLDMEYLIVKPSVCGDGQCTGYEDSASCCKDCGCGEDKSCLVPPGDPTGSCINDKDGDMVADDVDAFPDDPTEWNDSDNDGVGDNSDVFPNDPNEQVDSDGDGVGDNADAFPNDPDEQVDSDGDGVGDNADCNNDNPNINLCPDGSLCEAGECKVQDSDGDGVNDDVDVCENNKLGKPVYVVPNLNAGCQLGDINADNKVQGTDIDQFINLYNDRGATNKNPDDVAASPVHFTDGVKIHGGDIDMFINAYNNR